MILVYKLKVLIKKLWEIYIIRMWDLYKLWTYLKSNKIIHLMCCLNKGGPPSKTT